MSRHAPSAPRTCTTKHSHVLRARAAGDATNIDRSHNMRLETLLSVDDYLRKVVHLLEGAGALEETFILYTSDHGFQLGQHRLPGDKRHLCETNRSDASHPPRSNVTPWSPGSACATDEHDIRIPFFVRGPGVSAGIFIESPVLSIDVAPTLTQLGTGTVPDDMDGRSFLPLLKGATRRRHSQLARRLPCDVLRPGPRAVWLAGLPTAAREPFPRERRVQQHVHVHPLPVRAGGFHVLRVCR